MRLVGIELYGPVICGTCIFAASALRRADIPSHKTVVDDGQHPALVNARLAAGYAPDALIPMPAVYLVYENDAGIRREAYYCNGEEFMKRKDTIIPFLVRSVALVTARA